MLLPTVTAVLISGHEIDHLADTYGYGLVFLLVGLQCSGVPVPGTSALAAAAIYAGATHRLEIAAVICAAAAGAIVGYLVGFQLGRWGGDRLVARYGRYLRLTPERLLLGRYVFDRHGGKVVFFGRFVIGLRTYAGVLAGANRMQVPRFIAFDVLGGVAWALLNGLGSFYVGHALVMAGADVGVAIAVVVVVWVAATVLYIRTRGSRLMIAAEQAYVESARLHWDRGGAAPQDDRVDDDEAGELQT